MSPRALECRRQADSFSPERIATGRISGWSRCNTARVGSWVCRVTRRCSLTRTHLPYSYMTARKNPWSISELVQHGRSITAIHSGHHGSPNGVDAERCRMGG
jgi:hypothetical protein